MSACDSNTAGKPACLWCRSKKVKCTRDRDGCQRCRVKGRKCVYMDKDITSNHMFDLVYDSSHINNNVTSQGKLELGLESIRSDSCYTLGDVTSPQSGTYVDSDQDGGLCDGIVFDLNCAPDSCIDDSTVGISVSGDMFTEDLNAPTWNLQTANHSLCKCSTAIIDALASIELHLPQDSLEYSLAMHRGAVSSMFQCQSEVMKVCRQRIECGRCPLEFRDGILIVSICSRILNSLYAIKAASMMTQNDTFVYQWSTPSKGSQTSQSSPIPLQISCIESTSTLDLGSGPWNIDQQDTILIIQSLLSSRLQMLKQLLICVRDVADLRNWIDGLPRLNQLFENAEAWEEGTKE